MEIRVRGEREKERERARDRESETEKEREKKRKRERKRGRKKERKKERKRERGKEREKEREEERNNTSCICLKFFKWNLILINLNKLGWFLTEPAALYSVHYRLVMVTGHFRYG